MLLKSYMMGRATNGKGFNREGGERAAEELHAKWEESQMRRASSDRERRVILNNKRAAKRKAHFSENTEINFQINFKTTNPK